jgi:hypothetical protein
MILVSVMYVMHAAVFTIKIHEMSLVVFPFLVNKFCYAVALLSHDMATGHFLQDLWSLVKVLVMELPEKHSKKRVQQSK